MAVVSKCAEEHPKHILLLSWKFRTEPGFREYIFIIYIYIHISVWTKDLFQALIFGDLKS